MDIQTKTTRISLRIPTEIDDIVMHTCLRIIRVKGKELPITKTKNEAYLDIIKRGLMTLEQEDGSD